MSDQDQLQPAATPTNNHKVLCVEDEHFISELYARALRKEGYEVTVIADGLEAFQAAKTNTYDVILLDLMIPNLPGVEILRALRDPALVPPVKAKIVITTNLEQPDNIRAEIENQADGYLVKAEITPHELTDYVNRIV